MYRRHYIAGNSEYGLFIYRLLLGSMDCGNDFDRVLCYEGWKRGVNCIFMNVSESLCSGKLGVWLVYIQTITREHGLW